LQYNVEGNLKYLGSAANSYLYLAGATSIYIESATINSKCKFIGEYAFSSCNSLTSVSIPDDIVRIGNYAFDGCPIEKATIPAILCRLIASSSLKEVVISSGESIPGFAFRNCSSLTSLVIGDSVTSIGDYAFSDCSSLTSIVVPNSVTSIGDDAFNDCSSLASIVIPDSVTSIGDGAFHFCYSLTSIKYRGTASQWQAITKSSSWDSYTGNYTITYNYTGN